MANKLNLDVDPNDPRKLEKGQQLPSLNEVPEAPLNPAENRKVKGEDFVQHIGRDPNDPRAA